MENWNTIFEDIGELKTYKSHHSLIKFGEKANALFYIKSGGLVLLHVHPETGEERAINFFIPSFHPFATIAESFYLGTPSNYHLKTFTRTELIKVYKNDFNNHVLNTKFGDHVQEYGIRSLIEKNELRAKLISFTSEEMLKYLHKEMPQILQNVPSKYVANFLGITPQWLSKLKHKL